MIYSTMCKKASQTATELELIMIGEAAKILGRSVQTLRHWEKSGVLKPFLKSKAGTRYYSKTHIQQWKEKLNAE